MIWIGKGKGVGKNATVHPVHLVLARHDQTRDVLGIGGGVPVGLHAALRVEGAVAVHGVQVDPLAFSGDAMCGAGLGACRLAGPFARAHPVLHVGIRRRRAVDPVVPKAVLGAHAGQHFLNVEVGHGVRPAVVVLADRHRPWPHGGLCHLGP